MREKALGCWLAMVTDFKSGEIVKGTIALAHALGMSVTAEGIASADQEKLLKSLRCDRGQGYLFSKPIPPESVAALLDRHS